MTRDRRLTAAQRAATDPTLSAGAVRLFILLTCWADTRSGDLPPIPGAAQLAREIHVSRNSIAGRWTTREPRTYYPGLLEQLVGAGYVEDLGGGRLRVRGGAPHGAETPPMVQVDETEGAPHGAETPPMVQVGGGAGAPHGAKTPPMVQVVDHPHLIVGSPSENGSCSGRRAGAPARTREDPFAALWPAIERRLFRRGQALAQSEIVWIGEFMRTGYDVRQVVELLDSEAGGIDSPVGFFKSVVALKIHRQRPRTAPTPAPAEPEVVPDDSVEEFPDEDLNGDVDGLELEELSDLLDSWRPSPTPELVDLDDDPDAPDLVECHCDPWAGSTCGACVGHQRPRPDRQVGDHLCPDCDGEGTVRRELSTLQRQTPGTPRDQICPACDGEGRAHHQPKDST